MPHTLTRRTSARVVLLGLLTSSAVTLAPTSAAVAQTADPAPSATGQVVLLGSTAVPGTGSLTVVGEVRNDWNRVAGNTGVHIDLLDASGGVLSSGEALTSRQELGPGERSGFAKYFTLPNGYASYRVSSVETNPSPSVPNHNFEVTITSATRDKVVGTIKNTNTAATDRPEVELLFRDSAGAVYDVETFLATGTLEGGGLAAGETAPFEVTRYSSDPSRDGGTVSGRAEVYTAPSPYPSELGLRVPKRVVAGQTGRVEIVVRGKGATGPAPAGLKVQLFGREAGQSAFRLLRTVTTTSGGTVELDLRPQRDIRWQARVPAATNALPAASGYTLTQVAFGVVTNGTTSGGTAYFRGSVRPASPGAVVYLQQQSGGVFRNVASQKLSRTSTYAFTVRKPSGRYVYRVYKPAVPGNQAGTGDVLVLTVY